MSRASRVDGKARAASQAGGGQVDRSGDASNRAPARLRERNPLEKALRLLTWVADTEAPSWGVREVARELGMAPSTAYRTLSMLEDADVVTLDVATGRYRLALEYLRLSSRLAADVPIRRAARPKMIELVESTGETAYLGLYDPRHMKMMYVDLVESPHPVQYTMARYEWLELCAGAGGLGILPFLRQDEIDRVLATTELRPLTPDTITDSRKLRQELELIRKRGYTVSVGQRIAGAVGIAAPIFGPDQLVIGDLVLALPASRYARRKAPVLGRRVADAAAEVSHDLGGTAPGRKREVAET